MRIPACVSCALPVLQLRGQHAQLSAYVPVNDVPPAATAGAWHLTCLAQSKVASMWHEALVRNHMDVRGFTLVTETPGWTVLEAPNTCERVAFARSGATLSLKFKDLTARPVPGGALFPLKGAEFNLEWDAPIVRELQATLRLTGKLPIRLLAAQLGMAHRLSHPDLLTDAALRLDPELAAHWGTAGISARVDLSVFVPQPLLPFVHA